MGIVPAREGVRQKPLPPFRWLAEIQLRAKRRIGELSAALETIEGEHLKRVPDAGRIAKRAALTEAGLSKSEAHRCEQIARVEEQKFWGAVLAHFDGSVHRPGANPSLFGQRLGRSPGGGSTLMPIGIKVCLSGSRKGNLALPRLPLLIGLLY